MTLSQEQLEWIVSEVVRRLRATAPVAAGPVAAGPVPEPVAAATDLTLSERLVTTETLRGRLENVRQVTVATKAIVTPAVVDLLKEKQIAFVRGL